MVKVGSGTMISTLVSVLSVKLLATLLGPVYVGLFATLKQTRLAGVTAATMNGQTALVQGGAYFDGSQKAAYFRTVLALFSVATILVAAIMVGAAGPIARWTMGATGSSPRSLIAWLALPVALGSAFAYLSGLLNSLQAFGRLALAQVAGAIAACLAVYPAALLANRGQPLGLVGIVAVSSAASLAVAVISLRPYRLTDSHFRTQRWISLRAARHFLSISGATFGTGLLTSAVLLWVRAGVIRSEGLYKMGLFDAAWAVSVNYVALVLTSLQTYCLPTLSQSRTQDERRALMERVFRVYTLAMIPIITAMVILKPLVLVIGYSSEFRSSVEFLRWTLLGDYIKITGSILALPMLALADIKVFVLSEIVLQLAFASSSRIFSSFVSPAEAAAMAFLAMYVVYLGVCYIYAHWRCSFSPSGAALFLWCVGLLIILGASVDTWRSVSVEWTRVVIWVGAALCASGLWMVAHLSWFQDARQQTRRDTQARRAG